MDEDHRPVSRRVRLFRFISILLGFATILVGGLVLVGWAFDVPLLKSVLTGLATMKVNSAIAFILAGASLVIVASGQRDGKVPLPKWVRLLSQICAGGVILIGLLTLIEYIFRWDLGIDQLLFREPAGAPGASLVTPYPGRMSSGAAFNFVLIGTALLLLQARRGTHAAQIAALIAGVIGLFNFLAYAYVVTALAGVSSRAQTALHTTVLFVLISTGLILARADIGPARLLTSDTLGGVIFRRLMPVALVLPLLLNWLRVLGEEAGWYSIELGLPLLLTANIVLLGGLVWWNAVVVDRVNAQRTRMSELERRREETFQLLFKNNPLPMWVYDLETLRFLEVNNAATESYGYSRDEFLSMRITDTRPQEEVPRLLENLLKSRPNLQVSRTWRHRKKSGEIIDVQITSHTIDFSGRQSALVVAEDITERTRSEAALRESEARYRSLVEISPDAITLTDPRGDILLSNQRAAALYRYGSAEEMIGRNAFEFIAPEATDAAMQAMEKLLEEGTVTDLEYTMLRKDGSRFPAEVSGVVLVDVQGQPRGILSVSRDITERKEAEERVTSQLRRINALHNIDMAITASLDLRVTLNVFLDQVTTQLAVDAADVLLLKPGTQTLEYAVGRGFRFGGISRTRLRLGEGHAGLAALERRIIHIRKLGETDDLLRAPLLQGEDFVAYYAVPLIAKGRVQGVLEVYHRAAMEPDAEWLGFLETLAGQAAIAVDNATLFDDLQRSNLDLMLAYDSTLEGWSRALDLRDKETEGHTQRVTEGTVRLARLLGMTDDELVHVRRGALLHDIGKMGVPDAILLKPGPLTEDEWRIMRLHPVYAYDMLYPIAFLRPALDIPYCHHEKWDGTGYPRGLKGEQIPMAARVFAVVDVWDALRSDRPYREGWSAEKVQDHIRSLSGTHFEPRVVAAFMSMEVWEPLVKGNEEGTSPA